MTSLDLMGPTASAEALSSAYALAERPIPSREHPVFVADIEFLTGAIHRGLGSRDLVSVSLLPNMAEFLLETVADAAKYPPRPEAKVFAEMSDEAAQQMHNIVQRAGTAGNGKWENLRRMAVTLAKRAE